MNETLQTLVNGLTYEGEMLDSVIGYALIALSLAPYLLIPSQEPGRDSRGWIVCLTIVAILQVTVWFTVPVVGVSLVWCAMGGYLLMDYSRGNMSRSRKRQLLAILALVTALMGIVYCAVAFPIITTIAHISAVLVGISLFLGVKYLGDRLRNTRHFQARRN